MSLNRVPSPEPRDLGPTNPEIVKCPVCGATFFERVELRQFPRDHSVIIGQKVPELSGQPTIYVLRCGSCREMLEPNVLYSSQDSTRKLYEKFLDEMEGKAQ